MQKSSQESVNENSDKKSQEADTTAIPSPTSISLLAEKEAKLLG